MAMQRISVVVASRNDDHGENLLWRTQVYIDMLYQQMRRWGIDVELILVEWNPVPDAPFLHNVLRWPQTDTHWQGRVFVIHDYIHQEIVGDTGLDFFQWYAKNVGIRRASYEWILCSNPDAILSDELMAQVSKATERGMYSTHRRDLGTSFVPYHLPRERILKFCADNVVRENNCALFNVLTDGCGDFMLAPKRDWIQGRGYPEFKTWSIHLDSLALLQMIYIGGLRQVVLDGGVFHIAHEGSWTTSCSYYGHSYPQYKLSEVVQLCTRMHDEGIPVYENPPNWGLIDHVEIEAIIK